MQLSLDVYVTEILLLTFAALSGCLNTTFNLSSSRWMVSGVGDAMKPDQMYEHPESPVSGEYMTSQVISFEKIKLTNHEKPGNGQVNVPLV